MFALLAQALCAMSIVVLAIASPPASAAQGDPLGAQFDVQPTYRPNAVATASDAVGNTIVVWASDVPGSGGTPTSTQIFYRRYGTDGVAGPETYVEHGSDPDVAMNASGEFVIAFVINGGIYAKTYGANGSVVGSTGKLNTGSTVLDPVVAMADDRRAMVVWVSIGQDGDQGGLYCRGLDRFAIAELEMRANIFTTGDQRHPAIASLSDGGYVVAFTSPDASDKGIQAQRLHSNGTALNGVVFANTFTGGAQDWPDVAADAFGNYVVSWQSAAQNGVYSGIYGRRFTKAGAPLTAEFAVNQSANLHSKQPSVAAEKTGGFTVAWSQQLSGGGHHVHAQAFGADAVAQGSSYQMNGASAFGDLSFPSIAADDDGELIAVWRNTSMPIGQVSGIAFGRRFKGPVPIDLSVGMTDSADSAQVGSALAYSVQVANHYSNSTAWQVGVASGVVVDIALPPEVSVQSVSGTGWSCQVGADNLATCRRSTVGATVPVITASATAPASFGELLAHAEVHANQDDPNEFNNGDDETTNIVDTTPDPFVLDDFVGVPVFTIYESNTVTISGISEPTTVWISSGEFSIDGGPWVFRSYTNPATISNGQSMRVRHMSSGSFSTRKDSTLHVGGFSETFSTTTEAADTTPDAFTFADVTEAPRASEMLSNQVMVRGINTAAPVSISGGEYSINSGAWTSAAGTISRYSTLRVRHTSASAFGTTVTTTVTIGGFSESFSSTTLARDTTPDAYTFVDQTDVLRAATVVSDPITIAGINDDSPLSIAGGEYSLNGGPWATAPISVAAGTTIRVRHVASTEFSTVISTVLTVGGVSDTFASTTIARDETPDAFDFADQSGLPDQMVRSNIVTVTGINAPVLVVSDLAGIYVNGAYQGRQATVQAGDTLQLEVKVPLLPNQKAVTSITVGTAQDTWIVSWGMPAN